MAKHDKYQTEKKVLARQKQNLNTLETNLAESCSKADKLIDEAKNSLRSKDIELPPQLSLAETSIRLPKIEIRSWADLSIQVATDSNTNFESLLSQEEISKISNQVKSLGNEFDQIHQLDAIDWSIAGVAGILASLADIFLVQVPKQPNLFGHTGADGGPLSNWFRDQVQSNYSPEEIKILEKNNWVPYDASTNQHLDQTVSGLGTRTHRFQSLGHDPILGWLFGVKDILNSEFTAVDINGHLIKQAIAPKDESIIGINIWGAFQRVFGHLKSDVSTSAGLPAPLTPLLQFIQIGSIGDKGRTIGQVARGMYTQGYDFSHFLAMSVCPMMIELIVRMLYCAKRMHEGNTFLESIPVGNKPKLQTMLFTAHAISAAANAGKVAITENPLSINYTQWVAFFRYLVPQLKWVLLDKPDQRFKYIKKSIDEDWMTVDKELTKIWSDVLETKKI